MALQRDLTKTVQGFSGELVAKDAYFKIASIHGNKDKIEFNVIAVLNDEIIDGKPFEFVPTLDGDNFIKQAYDYLKTLPEFADAVDC